MSYSIMKLISFKIICLYTHKVPSRLLSATELALEVLLLLRVHRLSVGQLQGLRRRRRGHRSPGGRRRLAHAGELGVEDLALSLPEVGEIPRRGEVLKGC